MAKGEGSGKGAGSVKRVRSAKTGRYVPAQEAKRHPNTTVTETDKRKSKRSRENPV